MAATKSQFETTARIIKYALEQKQNDPNFGIRDIAGFFADAFENDNDRFNREKFMKACGFDGKEKE